MIYKKQLNQESVKKDKRILDSFENWNEFLIHGKTDLVWARFCLKGCDGNFLWWFCYVNTGLVCRTRLIVFVWEVAYRYFEMMNIQVDKDFNARLSYYCFARRTPTNVYVLQRAEAYSAPKTLKDCHYKSEWKSTWNQEWWTSMNRWN